MTLIDHFNQFWSKYKDKPFTPNETLLFFFLLDVWNNTGRKDVFEVKSSFIESAIGMNKMTLTRCRESLKKRGLIKAVKGSTKGKYPYYSLLCVTDNVTDNVTIHRVIRVIEKETSSNDDVKKAKLSSPIQERIDWESFKNTFNELLSSGIPKVIDIKQTRRDLVKARIKEYGKEAISIVLDKVQKSDFLMGRSRRPNDTWKCNFDFIFSKSGFTKIYEGNYDNGEQRTQTNLRASTKPGFNNFNESEARQVGSINSIEL